MADKPELKEEPMVPQAKYDAMVKERDDLKREHDEHMREMQPKQQQLVNDVRQLQKRNADLERWQREANARLPGYKPPYVRQEGDTQCEPVHAGEVCANCGWSSDKKNPKHIEPHPILR